MHLPVIYFFAHFASKKPKFSSDTQLAIEAVKKAGEVVLSIYYQDFSIQYKDDKEPLTKADLESNEILKKILSKSNYPILSEEDEDNKLIYVLVQILLNNKHTH